jgi:hypothetical protein
MTGRATLCWVQFTQTDPLAADTGSPYPSAYVCGNNNPNVYVDPSGMRGSLVFQTPNPLQIVLDGGGGPEDAKASFSIPKWPGFGRTRVNFFIKADLACLGICLRGDGTGPRPVNEFEPSSRVRFVLDHENGKAFVTVSHSTAELPFQGATIAQRPIKVGAGPYDQRAAGGDANFVNNVRVAGLNPADNLVLQYRFFDSFVPQGAGGVSPAVDGLLRFSRVGSNMRIEGKAEFYPSMEIIRDSSKGSARIYDYTQTGGPGEGLFRSRNVGPVVCSFASCKAG